MRYLMKQKWLSLGDDYVIKTAEGADAFYVDGRAFSWGDKLSLLDHHQNEVAFIAQKLLSWGPTYEIHRDGSLFAIIKKQNFTFFHCKFNIDVPGPDDYLAEGDFIDKEYTFTRGGQPVARVSKQFFSWTDTYGIDVAAGGDDITLLASTVVIDLCCHPDRKH